MGRPRKPAALSVGSPRGSRQRRASPKSARSPRSVQAAPARELQDALQEFLGQAQGLNSVFQVRQRRQQQQLQHQQQQQQQQRQHRVRRHRQAATARSSLSQEISETMTFKDGIKLQHQVHMQIRRLRDIAREDPAAAVTAFAARVEGNRDDRLQSRLRGHAVDFISRNAVPEPCPPVVTIPQPSEPLPIVCFGGGDEGCVAVMRRPAPGSEAAAVGCGAFAGRVVVSINGARIRGQDDVEWALRRGGPVTLLFGGRQERFELARARARHVWMTREDDALLAHDKRARKVRRSAAAEGKIAAQQQLWAVVLSLAARVTPLMWVFHSGIRERRGVIDGMLRMRLLLRSRGTAQMRARRLLRQWIRRARERRRAAAGPIMRMVLQRAAERARFRAALHRVRSAAVAVQRLWRRKVVYRRARLCLMHRQWVRAEAQLQTDDDALLDFTDAVEFGRANVWPEPAVSPGLLVGASPADGDFFVIADEPLRQTAPAQDPLPGWDTPQFIPFIVRHNLLKAVYVRMRRRYHLSMIVHERMGVPGSLPPYRPMLHLLPRAVLRDLAVYVHSDPALTWSRVLAMLPRDLQPPFDKTLARAAERPASPGSEPEPQRADPLPAGKAAAACPPADTEPRRPPEPRRRASIAGGPQRRPSRTKRQPAADSRPTTSEGPPQQKGAAAGTEPAQRQQQQQPQHYHNHPAPPPRKPSVCASAAIATPQVGAAVSPAAVTDLPLSGSELAVARRMADEYTRELENKPTTFSGVARLLGFSSKADLQLYLTGPTLSYRSEVQARLEEPVRMRPVRELQSMIDDQRTAADLRRRGGIPAPAGPPSRPAPTTPRLLRVGDAAAEEEPEPSVPLLLQTTSLTEQPAPLGVRKLRALHVPSRPRQPPPAPRPRPAAFERAKSGWLQNVSLQDVLRVAVTTSRAFPVDEPAQA